MEERKGDARVSVISGLFFVCIIAGGVFLFMYMLLPEGKSKPWYPFAGMVLVAIPWTFWLTTCVYRCFRPAGAANVDSGRYAKAGSSRAATIPTTSGVLTAGNASATGSPHSPDGERKVQFAGVVVMGNEDQDGRVSEKGSEINHQYQAVDLEHHHNGANESVGSTDSEMPLRLMV